MKKEFPDEAYMSRAQRRVWNMLHDNLRLSSKTIFFLPRHHGKTHLKKAWGEHQEHQKVENALDKMDLYTDTAYSKVPIPGKSKVFYFMHEWSGWRFYVKAIRHRDWQSIKGHILNSLGLR